MHIMCIWPYFRFLTPKWPFLTSWWPRMTSRRTPLNSKENFQSIYMHIWPEIKILILLWPLVTLNVWLWPFDLLKWPNQTQIRILRAVKVLHHPSKFWNSIKKISRLYTNNAFSFYLKSELWWIKSPVFFNTNRHACIFKSSHVCVCCVSALLKYLNVCVCSVSAF